jgi:hypothetical protein
LPCCRTSIVAIPEIRRLEKALGSAASALNQVLPGLVPKKLKDVARKASENASNTLEKEL